MKCELCKKERNIIKKIEGLNICVWCRNELDIPDPITVHPQYPKRYMFI